MEYIEDVRQERNVRHLLKDILVIVLFATLANADDWVEIALFAQVYEDYLKKYIELKKGEKRIECRYFISSLKGDIETLSRAVRGHWSIESMHWHLGCGLP